MDKVIKIKAQYYFAKRKASEANEPWNITFEAWLAYAVDNKAIDLLTKPNSVNGKKDCSSPCVATVASRQLVHDPQKARKSIKERCGSARRHNVHHAYSIAVGEHSGSR